MTTRTVKFLGGAVGGPANAIVKFGGTTIFSGNVTNEVPPASPTLSDSDVFCTTEIAMDLQGNVPMEITVKSGTLRVSGILANYGQQYQISGDINGVHYEDINDYSANVEVLANAQVDNEITRIVSTGSTVFKPINVATDGSYYLKDPRNDKVYIDGRLIPVQRPPYGPWVYRVSAGSTLTCNVEVAAGIENSIVVPNT